MPATDLIVLAALPGVSCGVIVALFTWKAQPAAHAFLLAELVWLAMLAVVAVVPAHGATPHPRPRPVCVNKAEFVDSVPRIDAVAEHLRFLSTIAVTKADGETLAEASNLLKLSIRLLALSQWVCR